MAHNHNRSGRKNATRPRVPLSLLGGKPRKRARSLAKAAKLIG